MDPKVEVNAEMPLTMRGKLGYIHGHLSDPRESGEFGKVAGYLSRDGQVLPIIYNQDLWEMVGMESGAAAPSHALLKAILGGQNLLRAQLAPSRSLGAKALHEVLLTLPGELSELATRMHPRFIRDIQDAVAAEVKRSLESRSIQVRQGKESRAWMPARVLCLGYRHATNKHREPHAHEHLLVFPLAFDGRVWRTVNLRDFVKVLHKEVRPKISEAILAVCERWGVKAEFNKGLASESDGPCGWTVTGPGMEPIAAGSIDHFRTAEVNLDDAFRLALQGGLPRWKDLMALREASDGCTLPWLEHRRIDCGVQKRLKKFGLEQGFEKEPGDQYFNRLEDFARRLTLGLAIAENFRVYRVLTGKATSRLQKCLDQVERMLPKETMKRLGVESVRSWERAVQDAVATITAGGIKEQLYPLASLAFRLLKNNQLTRRDSVAQPQSFPGPLPDQPDPLAAGPVFPERLRDGSGVGGGGQVHQAVPEELLPGPVLDDVRDGREEPSRPQGREPLQHDNRLAPCSPAFRVGVGAEGLGVPAGMPRSDATDPGVPVRLALLGDGGPRVQSGGLPGLLPRGGDVWRGGAEGWAAADPALLQFRHLGNDPGAGPFHLPGLEYPRRQNPKPPAPLARGSLRDRRNGRARSFVGGLPIVNDEPHGEEGKSSLRGRLALGPHPSYAIRDRIVAGRSARQPLGNGADPDLLMPSKNTQALVSPPIAAGLDPKVARGVQAAIDMATRSIGTGGRRTR